MLGMGMGGMAFGRRGYGRDSWVEHSMREMGRKEELVDVGYTEKLKKFIGDPFDVTKTNSQ